MVRGAGNLEFEVGERIAFISRVKFRSGSCYVLVPKPVAREWGLKDGDVVGVVVRKIRVVGR